MFNTQEKKERAIGTKLFFKAYRCNSPKCVTLRRPHRPGLHGQARHSTSEMGAQLNEKQKIRVSYGLRENQIKKIFSKAAQRTGVTGTLALQLLERRLDNAAFRLGLAPSRSVARQLVGHGHIFVNGRRVTVPSFLVRVDDVIGIRPQSKEMGLLKDVGERLKKYETPAWLTLNKESMEGKIVSLPKDIEVPFDVALVVDYYSNKK